MAALAATGFVLLAEAQRIALVRPAESDAVLLEAFSRLTAELRLQDFEMTVVEAQADPRGPETLESVAKRTDALACVALVRRDGKTAVEVWLADPTSGRPVLQRLEPNPGSELPNLLAIRAVDLLRVSLREQGVERPEEPPRVDRAPPPPDAPVPPPAPSRDAHPWEIRAEGLMIFDSPTLGAAFGAGLGLSRSIFGPLRAGIFLTGPLVGPSWDESEGSGFIRQQMGWGEVRISWWRTHGFDLGASLAGGVHHLAAHGTAAKSPLLPQNDQVWSLAGVVGADGSFRFTSNIGAAFAIRAIGLTPRPGVGVGTSSTVLHLPLLSASAGLLVAF